MDEAIQVVIEIGQGGMNCPAEPGGHNADLAVTPATSCSPKQRPEAASALVIIPSSPSVPHLLALSITSFLLLHITFLPCMICAGTSRSLTHTPLQVVIFLRCIIVC